MKRLGAVSGVLMVLVLLVTGCNLPGAQSSSGGVSVEQAAATIVAMTMQAHGSKPADTATASHAPATPTTKPTLYIHADAAKCKSGPGPDFEVITTFNAGTTVDLNAKDTADGYWMVKDPGSGSSCWVQVQDSTPAGSFDVLPEVTPQASSETPPNRPTLGNWNFSCDNTSLTTTLAWNAPSGAVNGYRVYREGTKITDVGPGTTTYKETIAFTYGSSMNYAVEAYNNAGASPQLTWNFSCP